MSKFETLPSDTSLQDRRKSKAQVIKITGDVNEILTQEGFMPEILSDITLENIQSWTRLENLSHRTQTTASGFDVIHDIDGGQDGRREVSLVTIKAEKQYPPHVHNESDAFFIVLEGEGRLLMGKNKKNIVIHSGDRIQVPRGAPHGFELTSESLRFISVQSPPIKGADGKFDLHVII